MSQLPQSYLEFQQKYPDIWQAYDQLGAAVHAGPLDEKSRALTKARLLGGREKERYTPMSVN